MENDQARLTRDGTAEPVSLHSTSLGFYDANGDRGMTGEIIEQDWQPYRSMPNLLRVMIGDDDTHKEE